MVGAIIQVIVTLVQATVAEAEAKKRIGEGAKSAPYYVECPRGRFSIIGFDDLRYAREYAVASTLSNTYRWNEKSEDRIAKIFENGGKLIETYVCGLPQGEYEKIEADPGDKEKSYLQAVIDRNTSIVRSNYPYYVETHMYDHITTIPIYLGATSLEQATKYAINYTIGLYKMNGQLSDKSISVFERGGRLVEKYIGGFPEAEYNRLKAEKESKEGKKEVKVVTSGGWDPSKMR